MQVGSFTSSATRHQHSMPSQHGSLTERASAASHCPTLAHAARQMRDRQLSAQGSTDAIPARKQPKVCSKRSQLQGRSYGLSVKAYRPTYLPTTPACPQQCKTAIAGRVLRLMTTVGSYILSHSSPSLIPALHFSRGYSSDGACWDWTTQRC